MNVKVTRISLAIFWLAFTVNVHAQAGKLAFVTTTLPNGTIGVGYSQVIQVTGGVQPYTFFLTPSTIFTPSNPPPGLTLSAGGTFSGTPTKNGNYTFGVTVKDASTSSAATVFSVNIGSTLSFTTASPLPSGVAGSSYTQVLFVTGGTPPYNFSFVGAGPPGLGIAASGAISGVPSSVGTFSFTAQVVDAFGIGATQQYSVTFTAGAPLLQVSALALDFEGQAGGDAPPSQSIAIISTNSGPVNYAVKVDGGPVSTTAPAWITVKPSGGSTPGRLTVTADPGNFQAGTYPAGIHITVPGNLSQSTIDISVTFNIAPRGPQLEVFPSVLKFASRAQVTSQLSQPIMLHNNGGGGGLPFTVAVAGKSNWITSVAPNVGQTVADSMTVLQVQVNTAGLAVGHYRDVVQISWLGGIAQVPVVLFVSDAGPILDVSAKGLRFIGVAGSGNASTRQVKVLNRGDPASSVHWAADLQSGGEWLNILTPSGLASTSVPGILALQPGPNVAGLPAGPRYALVRVQDPAALNSPQYVAAVFDIAANTASPAPNASPAGLVFTLPAGSRQSFTNVLNVEAASNAAVTFQASASTSDGTSWLSVTPVSGSASSLSPGAINITANTGNLNGGIYTGEVDVAIGSLLKTISVTFVVTNQTFAVCTPTRVSVTPLALTTHFSIPSGFPAVLSAQITDDCGNPVSGANVFASFTNQDPAVVLLPDGGAGTYSAAWAPGASSQQMNVTFHVVSGGLLPASATLIGDVLQNSVPALATNGTLNNLNTLIGGALSPGDVAQVFGSNLSTTTGSTVNVPLVRTFNGTDLRIGGLDAPLFYVSGGQLTAQIPAELAANRQYSVIGIVNGQLTLPDTIDLNPVSPGIAVLADGSLIAQHGDFSLVTSQNPAHRGEELVMYLVGMGATNPAVGSGQPAPGAEPLARPLAAPTVTIDNLPAQVAFAGMTPGGVGLFQINFIVPAAARTGVPLNVVVTQAGVAANLTTLTVPVIQAVGQPPPLP
jgi:uncharacterized protein (TIGR03437 family)